MKNLTRKFLIPLALESILGCATYQPIQIDNSVKSYDVMPIASNSKSFLRDLGNGYFARTDKAADTIDLAASALLWEVTLTKTNPGYAKKNTLRYDITNIELWNQIFSTLCKAADANKDYILEESEANDLLDLAYRALHKDEEIQWMEEDNE